MGRFIVFCRGNRVESFDSRELATAHIEANATEDAPVEAWEIQDTEAAPPTPRDPKPYSPPKVRELDEVEIVKVKERLKKKGG